MTADESCVADASKLVRKSRFKTPRFPSWASDKLLGQEAAAELWESKPTRLNRAANTAWEEEKKTLA
jgi:hypothetical protein